MVKILIIFPLLIVIYKSLLITCFQQCLENEFQCPLTGDCIDKLMICDGFIDCPGYHDEFNCSSSSLINSRSLNNQINCPGFLCKDSDDCLPENKVCNGSPDCPNGGDELNCPVIGSICLPNCDYDEKQNITITRCLNSTSICDGFNNCHNGIDEINCDQLIPVKRSNNNNNNQLNETNFINCEQLNSFNCGDGKCIDNQLLCNGKVNCPNGLDEGISCNSNLTCETRTCTQKCLPLTNGSKCDCHEGYELLADGQTCEDIDECSMGPLERPCFQDCVNTLGSYRCACFEGWTLSADDKTCTQRSRTDQCIVNTNDPYLLMVKNNLIYNSFLRCIAIKSPIAFANLSTHISTFTYDQANWRIYYYSVPLMSINVIDVETKVTSKFVKRVNVTRSLRSLVFDDLTGNLYWIEPGKGSIEIVSTYRPNETITLIDGLIDANQLVLNQERSEMYISVTGFEPKILVASLHGKDIREIDSTGNLLTYPTALFVDKMGQRLYWSDSGTHEICFVSLLGRKGEFGPKQVIYKFEESVQSMIVHDDRIFIATKEDKLIQVDITARDSVNDRKDLKVPSGGGLPFNSIDLFFGFNYRYRSPCLGDSRGGCSHICTFIDSIVTCLCPKGMTLDSNGRTCVEKRTICPPDSLICSDGSNCFKLSTQCDGNFDCSDKSDELNCTSIKADCPADYDHCPTGTKCIPKIWFCDSFFDCPEGLDEKSCHKSCKSSEFNCGDESNQCIPSDWVCDEIVDCPNKSDEVNCLPRS